MDTGARSSWLLTLELPTAEFPTGKSASLTRSLHHADDRCVLIDPHWSHWQYSRSWPMSKYSRGNEACIMIYSRYFQKWLYLVRFPAQEIIAGASKVPSVIYYDNQGRLKAIGAEAVKDGIHLTAIEDDWYKAEWYAFPWHHHNSPLMLLLYQVQASFEIQIPRRHTSWTRYTTSTTQ